MHHSAIGGHSGQQGTYKRLQLLFHWPNMKKEVCKWVEECDVCQRVKSENVHSPGLLQPLPIPDQSWQDISMDFMEGLPNSGCKNAVLVVIHKFTKYGHFLAIKHPFSAQEFYADRLRSERIKLQPYRQSSIDVRRNVKLCAKYYDPYKIEQKIGSVAYRLQLPPGSQIHLVFHVSQLKRRIGPTIVPAQQPPLCDMEGKVLIQPVTILQRKMIRVNNGVGVKVLVQWANLSEKEASWEDWSYIKHRFPEFVAQLRP
ncbi:uncharacterized protein LOC142180799 [Nicotiana tabacum]|uniref:Uncharacterized protein LOC142180799 n=1 Tax=Nicotiana tabacum TaxID=4097 RepID=A0AC58UHM8_TOBAC